jgi:hypothetical protein
MKLSIKTILTFIGVAAVVVLALICFTTSGSGVTLNPALQASVDWAYLDEHRLSIELKITGVTSPQSFLLGCPLHTMTLQKPSGEVIGEAELLFRCWDDENHDFYIAQTFDHDLDVSSGEAQEFVLELVFHEGEPATSLAFEITPSEGLTLFPAQVVTKNDVSVELVSVKINYRTITSEICFDFPSLLDWQAFPYIEGYFEDQKGEGLSAALLDHDGDVMKTSHRCYEFTLVNPMGYDITTKENITLRIDELVTFLPEQISLEEVERANQRSEAKSVSFDVIPGDHTWDIKIISKPDDMSDEEAQHVAWESLREKVEGPWVFTIPLP